MAIQWGVSVARDLAVVVVSHNTKDLLRVCLRSLLASLARSQDVLSHELFVVDNGSHDGSPTMVADNFPTVRLIRLPENRGFAAGNNVAIRQAEARHVLLLNPDTETLGEAPARLVKYLDDHPGTGAAGGRLLNPDLTFQHSCFRFPTLPMTFLDFFPINHRLSNSRLNGRYPRAWYTQPFEIDHPLGACLIVRSEVIQQVGPLDEGFYMYCEEVDWCLRIKQAGWKIGYTPDAEIIHVGGASARQNVGPMFVELHRSRDRFFRKHYGSAFAGAARAIVRLGSRAKSADALRERERGQIDEGELRRRLAIYQEVNRW
ncbi:MAG TPA: glycosyltransferase family 2 protein [Chloroflexota bacterium]|nr:glycosyltransferase family 2 protein [Chloroflexota bacterium]